MDPAQLPVDILHRLIALVPIASFLTMSKIMDHSGQTNALAEGIASVA